MRGKPELCVESSASVILRPLRSGILTAAGRYFDTGSVTATSPRRAMSMSSRDVNTLVIEPISKTVSPSRRRLLSLARLPYATTLRPFASITPTTMPKPAFSTPIRSARILRISASDGTWVNALVHERISAAMTRVTRRVTISRLLHQIVQWDPSERKQDAKADRLVEAEILTRYRVHQLPANAHLEFFCDEQGERVTGARMYVADI